MWNPLLYCGMSQVAVPSPGIFYPATWLFALTTYSQALAWQMVLHQTLAGGFMFLLVSSFGWGFAPSAAAALTFGLTGYMFALTTNFTLAASSSCLPLLLWSFRSIAVAWSLKKKALMFGLISLGSLATYLVIAAGRPEIFAPSIVILIVFALLNGFNNQKFGVSWRSVIQGWAFQLMAGITGLLLTMPILLPLAEWAKLSPRSIGLTVSHAMMWSCNWYDWACLVLAQPFGDLLVLGAPLLHYVCTRQLYLPYITSDYIGPIAFTLSLWGFFDKHWSWRPALICTIVLFVILCLGEFTPVDPFLITHFPKFSILRYPIKMIIFIIFCLAISGARGLLAVRENALPKAAYVTSSCMWTFALFLGMFFALVGYMNASLNMVSPGIPSSGLRPLGVALIFTSVFGILLSAMSYFVILKKQWKRFGTTEFIAFLLVLMVANLSTVAWNTRQMTEGPDFFKTPTLMAGWLQKHLTPTQGRLLNTYFDPISCPPKYRYKPGTQWTPSFYEYSRQLGVCNSTLDNNTANTFGYEAGETNAYRKMVLDTLNQTKIDDPALDKDADIGLYKLCLSTSTEFVSSQIDRRKTGKTRVLNPEYFEIVESDTKMNLRLYRVKNAGKRAFFAKNWKFVNSQDEIAEQFKTENAPNFEPLKLPLIERKSAIGIVADNNLYAPEIVQAPEAPVTSMPTVPLVAVPDDKKVEILKDSPEHVSVSVASESPGFVILNDHFYPGWQASIDSLPTKTYRANTEARAVYVSAGRHLIEFDFRPDSLYLGLKFAVVGAFLMICYLCTALFPSFWRFTRMMAAGR